MIFLIEPNNNYYYGNRQQTAGKNKGRPNCWATVQINPIITVTVYIIYKRLIEAWQCTLSWLTSVPADLRPHRKRETKTETNWNHNFKLHTFLDRKMHENAENSLHISLWLCCSLSLFCVQPMQKPLQIFLKFSSVFIVFTFGIVWGDKLNNKWNFINYLIVYL